MCKKNYLSYQIWYWINLSYRSSWLLISSFMSSRREVTWKLSSWNMTMIMMKIMKGIISIRISNVIIMIIIIEPLSDQWQPTIQPHEPATKLSVFLFFLTASGIWFIVIGLLVVCAGMSFLCYNVPVLGRWMCKKCMAICFRKLLYLTIQLGTTRYN